MKLKEYIKSSNTGLDAIKRAPIVEHDTGLKCIRISDISQNNDIEEWGFTLTTESDKNKFILNKNDILVARTGATVGVSYYVKNDLNSVHNNGTIRLRTIKDCNPQFVYYNFQTKEFRTYIENISCVATQPNLRIDGLLRYNIPDFSMDTQNRIVKVLNSFDELIEVNNKKIKVLENMVDEIYKEWFVRFRFPGFENFNFKESTPSGWTVGSNSKILIPKDWHYGELSEIAEFKRGINITSAEMIEGKIPVISAGIEPSGYHNVPNVYGVSLTMSASGANAGYLKYNLQDIWAADCSYYQNEDNIWFVYSSLKFIKKAIDNLQVGSAQPHVYPKNINKLNIIIPELEYIKVFNDIAKVNFEEINNLCMQNINLRKQRDLLLPRLMSGKLEVK